MSIEKISVESKQELKQMITKQIDNIEEGLTAVCSDVPINDKTTVDMLCHDSDGRLVILQMNVKEEDNMLLQGIQSMDYVDKFKSFLKATYNKHKIDDKEKPRLILIAPSFSETVRHTVEHMQGIHVDLYGWEYLRLGDHKGFRLQPIFVWKAPGKTKEKEETRPAEKTEKKKEKTPEKKEKPKPEPPKEEFPKFSPPIEKPEEEPTETKPEKKEERPKRKLRLF